MLNLVYSSGQNIDRLVSVYRACKKTGKQPSRSMSILRVFSKNSPLFPIPIRQIHLKAFVVFSALSLKPYRYYDRYENSIPIQKIQNYQRGDC